MYVVFWLSNTSKPQISLKKKKIHTHLILIIVNPLTLISFQRQVQHIHQTFHPDARWPQVCWSQLLFSKLFCCLIPWNRDWNLNLSYQYYWRLQTHLLHHLRDHLVKKMVWINYHTYLFVKFLHYNISENKIVQMYLIWEHHFLNKTTDSWAFCSCIITIQIQYAYINCSQL